MGSSTHSQAIIELGKRLVQELGVDDSNDTLSRWMAHYIAEKIDEAGSVEGDRKRAAMRECCSAILKLWEHRSSFPTGRRPFGDFESLFETLSSLNIDDRTPRYFRTARMAAAVDNVVSESQQWLNAAIGLDDAARVLIRYCLAVAAENAVNKSREWIRLIEALDRPKAFDVQIVHFVANDVDALAHPAESNPERERLAHLKDRLDAFTRLASSVSKHLEHQLQSSNVSTKARKRGRSADPSAKKSKASRRAEPRGGPKRPKRRSGR